LGLSMALGPRRSGRHMDAKTRERYSRQILFAEIGEEGQERLRASSAAIVGCGALGTALANLLVRAGVGHLRIIDRDFVEDSNLQRQTLFDESDVRDALPKAVAAERKLSVINSDVKVEGVVADLDAKNAHELLDGFPLLLDGTDNFEARLLVNDYSVKSGTPWIYAAVVASYGVTMPIRPGQTACLACLLESDTSSNTSQAQAGNGESGSATAMAAGTEATCDTAGVLGAAAGVIASIEACSAIKMLLGKRQPLDDRLQSFDVWTGRSQSIRIDRRPGCRACGGRDFRYLTGEAQPHVTMCGRDSVQIHERRRRLNLAELSRSLAASAGDVRHNDFLLRFRVPPYEVTVFADGRAIIKGTRDPAVARSLYARYLGA
jgi:bacteriocin biosynthesis cyclodehydratase domain-containing protein